MKLLVYSFDKYNDLEILLQEFSNEVLNSDRVIDANKFIMVHSGYIYMLYKDNKCIGFTSYAITDNCGLDKEKLINDFVYIKPEYRNTKAFLFFMVQTGKIASELKLSVQIPTNNEMLITMAGKFKAKPVYNVFEYSVSESMKEYERLKKILYKEK